MIPGLNLHPRTEMASMGQNRAEIYEPNKSWLGKERNFISNERDNALMAALKKL